MKKLLTLVTIALTFLSSATFAESLKVASWNIAWLGSHEYNQRNDADYQKLAHYAQALDADVIALQEVESEKWAKKVFGADYDYYFTTKDWVQRVGVAVRKSSGYKANAVEYVELDQGLARRGMDVTLTKNGNSVRLLAVHMKSGCFDKALDQVSIAKMPNSNKKEQYAKIACAELAKQAKPLEAWVDARAKEDVPFILLGDFNRRFVRDISLNHSEIQGLWQSIDDEGAEALWAPTINAESKCWGGYYKDYIDHIVFDPRAKALYVENSFEQLVFDAKYTKELSQTLSDHCPISVELTL
ncbi:MAG: endonuclease/exonuclease/phosphatase family protein [Cognaticolwellia sp.]